MGIILEITGIGLTLYGAARLSSWILFSDEEEDYTGDGNGNY